MPSIFVTRYAGDKRGEDIVDPLLNTVEAQLARGTAELDAHSTTPQTVNLVTVYRPGVELGQLAEVHDAMQGVSYRGKITGISHRISSGTVTSLIDIVRPVVAP